MASFEWETLYVFGSLRAGQTRGDLQPFRGVNSTESVHFTPQKVRNNRQGAQRWQTAAR